MNDPYICSDCGKANADYPYQPCRACALWREKKLAPMRAAGVDVRTRLERVDAMQKQKLQEFLKKGVQRHE